MSKLSDELLDRIANSSGRCYPHEGKAMAEELIEFRKAAAQAVKLSQTQPVQPPPGWGLGSIP